ncbi:hypothetical protein HON22_02020 [Candidatus Peregrinibacteria bacterium]|jgi:hypothetical protein|nr:hypothetical protein [Candidatus Peregrinibacteria bacterium]
MLERFETPDLENIVSVFDSNNPPSLKDMGDILHSLDRDEERECQGYDPKILAFKNAVQAEEIKKEGDNYILTLPSKEDGSENIITLSIDKGCIDSDDDEWDFDYLQGALIIPYMKVCNIVIQANNIESLYLPDMEKAWEIVANNASIIKAPRLKEIAWKCSIQNVREGDFRRLKEVDGVILLPSLQSLAGASLVFPKEAIAIYGVSFKIDDFSWELFHEGKKNKESLDLEERAIIETIIPYFDLQKATSQLETTPDSLWVLYSGISFVGLCDTFTCIRASNPMYWHSVSTYGEIMEHLSLYIIDPLRKKIQEATAVLDVGLDPPLGSIEPVSIVQNNKAVPHVEEVFENALILDGRLREFQKIEVNPDTSERELRRHERLTRKIRKKLEVASGQWRVIREK